MEGFSIAMNKRQLGKTDLWVNEIGYGSMSLANDIEKRPSIDDATRLLQRMVDEQGIELIDTADVYGGGEDETGYCERLIASALTGERRQRVVIATKGGFTRPGNGWKPDGTPEHLRRACDRSLAALDTDRIDLYQFHRPDPAVPIAESIGALADLQKEGKIRHIGVSNFNIDQLRQAMEIIEITSLQNPLAPMFYDEKREELLRFCEANDITWIAYAPLGGHRNAAALFDYEPWIRENTHIGDASLFATLVAWDLKISPRVIPIPATTRWEHLVENLTGASISLTDQDVEALKNAESWAEVHDRQKAAGDLAGAIEQLRFGLGLHPTDSNIWYNLACALALDGQSDSAIEALGRSIELGFDDMEHLRNDEDLVSLRERPEFESVIAGRAGKLPDLPGQA